MSFSHRPTLRIVLLLAAAAVIPACHDGDDDDTVTAPVGNLVILGRGGAGSAGDGGYGGYVQMYNYSWADIKILRTGTVDTSFSAPSATPYLGLNPLTVSTDTTLIVVATLTGTGQILAGATVDTVFGDDGATPATGLRILPGVTLTVPAHFDSDNADVNSNPANGTFEDVYLEFDNGVLIEGTLKISSKDLTVQGDAASITRATTTIYCDSLVVAASGRIDTSGADNPAGLFGGNGGWLIVSATGGVVIAGTIDASGGSDDNGGDGGPVDLDADYSVFVTGVIDTTGGTATIGIGGEGATVDILASANLVGVAGGAFVSGTITTTGGDGPAGGGSGAAHFITAFGLGSAVSSGALNSSGGNATVDGNGGDAGAIFLSGRGGGVRATGSIVARGGRGLVTGSGGDGDTVSFYSFVANDYVYNEYGTGLGIAVGANIDVGGGDGAFGGWAGGVYAYADSSGYAIPGDDSIVFAGYALVDLSGGDGSVQGGLAFGSNFLDNYGGYDYSGNFGIGDVVNEADWVIRGGNGGTGTGGYGGYLELFSDYGYFNYERLVGNSGVIDARGGNGATLGGWGGSVFLYGYRTVENFGAIDTSGGVGTDSTGGSAGYIDLFSDDVMTNAANLTSNGGNSVNDDGGDADEILIWGKLTSTSGNLSCRGGNAGTGIGDAGGDGGIIDIFGSTRPSSVSGTLNVDGGTGTATGARGVIRIDGIQIVGP